MVVTLFVLSHALNQRWQGDFWQHSACIREISIHPLVPQHPFLALDHPHEFFSPYAVAVGWASRVLLLDPVPMLACMGILNLSFLYASMYWFALLFTGQKTAAFYLLVFSLVFWGPGPLMFSGFFHLQVVGDTAPYPSLFCAALTLLALSLYLKITRGATLWWFAVVGMILSFVLLTHPHTFVALAIILGAFWFSLHRRLDAHTTLLTCAFAMAVGLALLWPYYPFADLIFHASDDHHYGNRWVYVNLAQRYWPLLLCIPILLGRWQKKPIDPLNLGLLGLLFVFVAAYVTEKYGFGRIITFMVFFVHLAAAQWLAETESARSSGVVAARRSDSLLYESVRGVALGLALYFTGVGIYRYRPGRLSTCSEVARLGDYVSRDSVILTDLATGRIVPSFSGKVVAIDVYQSFVPEMAARQRDVNLFFAQVTSTQQRYEILKAYKVDYVFINHSNVRVLPSTLHEIASLGTPVYCTSDSALIAIGRSPTSRNRSHQ